MLDYLQVTIPITPKPKKSVEVSRGQFYNGSARIMKKTREIARAQLPDEFYLLTGPLLLILQFVIPYPESASKVQKIAHHMRPHFKRPDCDNLEKLLNDALTGIIWCDDGQIAATFRLKLYTKESIGYTRVIVAKLPDEKFDPITVTDFIRLTHDDHSNKLA